MIISDEQYISQYTICPDMNNLSFSQTANFLGIDVIVNQASSYQFSKQPSISFLEQCVSSPDKKILVSHANNVSVFSGYNVSVFQGNKLSVFEATVNQFFRQQCFSFPGNNVLVSQATMYQFSEATFQLPEASMYQFFQAIMYNLPSQQYVSFPSQQCTHVPGNNVPVTILYSTVQIKKISNVYRAKTL